jgi:hypothetical protein
VPGAQIGHMPPAICTFVNLTHLDLSGNNITALPFHVSQLTSLQVGLPGCTLPGCPAAAAAALGAVARPAPAPTRRPARLLPGRCSTPRATR